VKAATAHAFRVAPRRCTVRKNTRNKRVGGHPLATGFAIASGYGPVHLKRFSGNATFHVRTPRDRASGRAITVG
jgi:hypothetical protein